MTPRFSIVMPAYQAAAQISEAIESVLAQTFGDWQLVIVDDGSHDRTGEIAREYAARDARIRVITQKNAGCGAARDTAVRNSSAPYLVRLDADDMLLPEYLMRMDAFIRRAPGYDVYACNGWHVAPDGTRTAARPGEFYESERSFDFDDMLRAVHVFTVAVFTRELFDKVGGIRPEVYCEDIDFWLRGMVIAQARIRYTPQYLALYRLSDSQMTADTGLVFDSREQVYHDLLDLSELTADQRVSVEAAIERIRQDRWIFNRRTRFVSVIQRIFGKRVAESASRAVHRASGWLKPVVRAVLRRGGDAR